jgi:RES domain-containing protein
MMDASPDWLSAVRACRIVPWSSTAWRFHSQRYTAASHGGSLKVTGRFHRGRDRYPEAETWPALYLALKLHIALDERLRHTTPQLLASLNGQRLSELRLGLHRVIVGCHLPDCARSAIPGISMGDLCRPHNYAKPHQVAAAARTMGVEGILVPSCTEFAGGNLVVFPDLLDTHSKIEVVRSEDPTLFINE